MSYESDVQEIQELMKEFFTPQFFTPEVVQFVTQTNDTLYRIYNSPLEEVSRRAVAAMAIPSQARFLMKELGLPDFMFQDEGNYLMEMKAEAYYTEMLNREDIHPAWYSFVQVFSILISFDTAHTSMHVFVRILGDMKDFLNYVTDSLN